MLTFAGLPLHPPSLQQINWARSTIDPAALWPEFVQQTYPGKNLAHLPFTAVAHTPIELGRLTWPRGATRFAVGHWLVDGTTADSLNALALTPQTLLLSDGTYTQPFTLFALPLRPLSQFPGRAGLSLLTLVDQRFFDWFETITLNTFGPGTTTWASVVAQLGLTSDAIPAAYLTAPAQLSCQAEALPIVREAVAASLGQKVYATFGGAIKMQNATNALATATANLAQPWPQQAGGRLNLTPALKPITITSCFPNADSTQLPLYTVPLTLSGLFDATIHDTAVLKADSSNAAELRTLAGQIATDHVAWQLANWDVVYNGCPPWQPEAFSEVLEYTHWKEAYGTTGNFSLRVRRDVWNEVTSPLLHRSSATETNATLQRYEGGSNVPIGGYYGKTAAGLGTVFKDGLCLATGDLSNATINLRNTQVYLNNDTFTHQSTSYYDFTQGPAYNIGIAPIVYETPVFYCGFQFWCCQFISMTGPQSIVFTPPVTQASTVYTLQSTLGDTTITGITPYALPRLVQQTPGISVHAAVTASDTFPAAPAGAPNQLIVKVFGKCADDLTMDSMFVTDNQAGGFNTYSMDTFTQNPAGGAFAGIWRCETPRAGTAPFVVSFGYTGTAGAISLVAEEVYGLLVPEVPYTPDTLDATTSAIGSSSVATPGSFFSTSLPEYEVLVVGSDDTATTASLILNGLSSFFPPPAYQTTFAETDGTLYAPGLAAYRTGGALAYDPSGDAFSPSVTFNGVVDWAAVQCTYRGAYPPQVMVLVNEGFYIGGAPPPFPIHLQCSDDSDFLTDNMRIHLPSVFTPQTGVAGGSDTPSLAVAPQLLTLNPYDAAVLWYDACVSRSWIVLAWPGMTWTLKARTSTGSGIPACDGTTPGSAPVNVYYLNGSNVLTDCSITLTAYNNSYAPLPANTFLDLILERTSKQFFATFTAEGVQVNGDAGTTYAQPIIDFESSDTTQLTVSASNDATNHRTVVTLTPTGGSSITTNAMRVNCPTQAIPSGVPTDVTFTVTPPPPALNPSPAYDIASNMATSFGCTIPVTGVYSGGAYFTFPNGFSNDISIKINQASVGGSPPLGSYEGVYLITSTPTLTVTLPCEGQCSVGAHITVTMYQGSGSTQGITGYFWLHQVH